MPATAPTPGPCDPKTVRFQLITPDSPHTTARLPMRVQIYPHDATDSIVTTVKNFYGLYSSPTSSKGVSFEDEAGNTMIARYENFRDNMVVYVRVIEEPALSPSAFATRSYRSPPAMANGHACNDDRHDRHDRHDHGSYHPAHGPLQHHLQPHHHDDFISRPGSRTSRKRSLSPSSARGRRSDSASTNSKNRSRSSKNRIGAAGSDLYGADSLNGYSSGDGAAGSTTGRVKEQQPIGNTEISVENIVEGGRRKRAKFESSELPLFAPPQMPAATSNPSVSPARRSDHRPSLPYVLPGQNPFNGASALQSPQNYHTHFGQGGIYATPVSDGRRTRASIGYAGVGAGMGVLPTPDPTVSSVSEEDKDVAMQLMRLGEMSNFSYGRTSTSTQDDTFSGRADAASSTGATSDSDSDSGCEGSVDDNDEEPPVPASRKQKLTSHEASRKIYQSVETGFGVADVDRKIEAPVPVPGLMAAPKLNKKGAKNSAGTNGTAKAPRAQASKPKPKPTKAKAASGGSKTKKQPSTIAPGVPMSPASLPASRKLSVASNGGVPIAAAAAASAALGSAGDEEIADLSSKPRCQRCRKSKKGCDRQRPCGRCRDAGIPAELCISEDEGNGRKGRYGRHMGVPIKKEAAATAAAMQPPPPPPTAAGVMTPSVLPAGQMAQQASPHSPYQLPPISALGPAGPANQANPAGPASQQILQKQLPPLLPPAPISSTPILAPTIPAMALASADKNKKRKR